MGEAAIFKGSRTQPLGGGRKRGSWWVPTWLSLALQQGVSENFFRLRSRGNQVSSDLIQESCLGWTPALVRLHIQNPAASLGRLPPPSVSLLCLTHWPVASRCRLHIPAYPVNPCLSLYQQLALELLGALRKAVKVSGTKRHAEKIFPNSHPAFSLRPPQSAPLANSLLCHVRDEE